MGNKVSIIKGTSSGIGEATAKELASVRIKLMLAARREDRLVKLKQEIETLSFIKNLKVIEWVQIIDVNIRGVPYGIAAV